MRTRRPISAVTNARKSAEYGSQATSQAQYDAAENVLDHSQPRDWGVVFAAQRKAHNDAATAAYRERLAYYESAEPDLTWLVEDVLRWNQERGISLPSPGDLEISEAQTAMAIALAGAINNLPPDARWKPGATTPVLNDDPGVAPRASRELANRVTRYFADNPRATYRQAANDLNTSPPAITACKRRILDECSVTGEVPPAWATRSKGPQRQADAQIGAMCNDELLAAMKATKDGGDE